MKLALVPNAAVPAGRIVRLADYLVSRARALFSRRIGAGLAVACLSAALAACGGGGDAGPANTSAASADNDAQVSRLSVGTGTADGAATASVTATWTDCATEGQTCAFNGQKLVRYGNGANVAYLTLVNGTACSNAVFGDPVIGTFKTCAYSDVTSTGGFDPSGWTVCAQEGGSCAFDGTRQVRYGTTSLGVTMQFASRTACTNAVFGDPVPYTAKTCWVANPAPVSAATETWTACAQENQFCAFTGTRAVRYGAASNVTSGSYSGGVNCSNAVFGDPVPYSAKSCSFSSIDTSTGGGSGGGAAVSSVTVPLLTASTQGAPLQLTAAVVPSASTAPIVWTVTDATIATVSSTGLATPLRTGFTSVTATVGSKTSTGTLTVRGPTPIPTRSQYVGTNVAGIAYYGVNFPFVDLMKSGGGWSSRDDQGAWGAAFPSALPDGTPTSLRPGQHALTPVAWDNTHYPSGRYTVLWDGDGSVSFPLSRVRIDESSANRIVVEPTDVSQMWVSIDRTNPANPVRNVRFLLPGAEPTYATQPFNPVYLQKIAPFSMLRYMDWGRTNGSPVVEWADRSLPTDVAYSTDRGVPIEVMIDLANSLHVDPWFCIPHKASDDYVRQFATLLHSRLDPTLRPHIEYSNEVWNSGFSQTTWASQQSDAQGLSRPWGTPSLFYAKRAVQMFKIMQTVYGSTDAHRLVRVIAGQAVWTQFLENALGYADTAVNADVMAIAPYFQADSASDPANVDASLRLSASQVVDQMLANVRGSVKSAVTSNAALAARYRLKLKAYESGPGDSTANFPADKQDAMTALYSAANADPRMKDLYVEYFSQWKALGGDTMNQYVDVSAWGKYGFWGALQWTWQDASTAPKYQGLMAFIATNPLAAQQTTLAVSQGR